MTGKIDIYNVAAEAGLAIPVRPFSVEISVNGEVREIPEGFSVAELLTMLELPSDRVAVELNKSIVRKRDWANTAIPSGARLEVVEFVGGG